MSRNNLILVVRRVWRSKTREFVVLGPLDADAEWSARAARRRLHRGVRLRERARALVVAHDRDARHRTEYGVRELTVWAPHVPDKKLAARGKGTTVCGCDGCS